MHDRVLSFVDLETSGPRAGSDRIIEIGVIQWHQGKIINTFETLVNPGSYVPEIIFSITGIAASELSAAPSFSEIAGKLHEMLSGTVILAHNARFDYGFLKAEFMQEGFEFNEEHLCTVRLSRKIFPGYKRHSLDALISRFSLSCRARHRALADAQVLCDFWGLLPDYVEPEALADICRDLMRHTAVPPNLTNEMIRALPGEYGVYTFYGNPEHPLYIGKSKNIRERVRSHFNESWQSLKAQRIFNQVERIEYTRTAGELGALLLESEMVKEFQPLHNKKLRRTRSLYVLRERLNEAGYKVTDLCTISALLPEELPQIVAVFSSKKRLQEHVREIAKIYSLCPHLLDGDREGACFYSELGYCRGACTGTEDAAAYNARFLAACNDSRIARWPYEGPILINESYPDDPSQGDLFVCDNWCIVAQGAFDESGMRLNAVTPAVFDRDVYYILRHYLRRHRGISVKTLTRDELAALW